MMSRVLDPRWTLPASRSKYCCSNPFALYKPPTTGQTGFSTQTLPRIALITSRHLLKGSNHTLSQHKKAKHKITCVSTKHQNIKTSKRQNIKTSRDQIVQIFLWADPKTSVPHYCHYGLSIMLQGWFLRIKFS